MRWAKHSLRSLLGASMLAPTSQETFAHDVEKTEAARVKGNAKRYMPKIKYMRHRT